MTELLKQSLRDGRYAVSRVLGEGSQAATFEAVDKLQGSLVAIKRFRVRGASSWKEVELAEREARVLAALSESDRGPRGKASAARSSAHVERPAAMPSNLPRYVEHFEEDGELYLVTEMIEGESLLALRKRGASLREADILRLLRDASVALEFLHGRSPPVIHRDIKPSNVLRRPDGSFAFIDFGSVRDRLKPEGGSTVVGTFGYMAPEQFQGRAMAASDVYAVGATALSMLTGEEPERLPHKGLAIDVPAALKPRGASPAMIELLSAMLEPDPDRRATRIGPLVARYEASSKGGPAPFREARSGPTSPRGEPPRGFGPGPGWGQAGPPGGRREEGEALRDALRAMQVERWAHRRRGSIFPPPLIPFFLIAITIGQVAVTLALGVFVPVLFAILSIVFGKGMRVAARTTRNASKAAVEAMSRAKDVVRGVHREEEEIDARAAGGEGESRPQRVRVAGPSSWEHIERETEKVARAARAEQDAREAAEAEEEAAEEERRARAAKKKAKRDRKKK